MEIQEIRKNIDIIDEQIITLLSKRGLLVAKIGEENSKEMNRLFDPIREDEILKRIEELNPGPYSTNSIKTIFREIFHSSLALKANHSGLKVLRSNQPENTVVSVRGVEIGGSHPQIIAGPCSIENESQLDIIAKELVNQGVKILRGGAFKPRTSPYSFQGLGEQGLIYLFEATRRYGMISISEVMDPRQVELMARYVDILQVGSRNMNNYSLLREVGQGQMPVLLKRGFGATIEEFMFAAEHILAAGNSKLILCERGIRTFETKTRFTLDVAAVALLKQESHLPVIADVSHASGQRRLILPLACSSLAAGADGIMVEVHNAPEKALSDKEQQLDLEEFGTLMQNISKFIK
jgi:3-deoxy-7-phosphoheptulonate synthase / chorismate mutase